jgi:hypothetical protein
MAMLEITTGNEMNLSAALPISNQGVAFMRIENFLAPAHRTELLRAVADRRHLFTAAQVTTKEPNFRSALVQYHVPDIFPLLRELIASCVPVLTRALGMNDFYPSEIEMQFTAHPAGAFFKRHRDNVSELTSRRAIS